MMVDGGKRRWRRPDKEASGIERPLSVKVKLSRGKRKASSRLWLQRQLADPYVRRAREGRYRCRSAFKLLEIHQKFQLIGRGDLVVDLGCSPGGWSQMALECGAGRVVGIDLQETESLSGAVFLQGDIADSTVVSAVDQVLGGRAHLLLSDMASAMAGHRPTDHMRTGMLAQMAAGFALDRLRPGGSFCCKVFQGGIQGEDLALLKANFRMVRHFKPPASRRESAETFVIAKGFGV